MEISNQTPQSQQPVSPTPPAVNSGKSKVIPIILGVAAAIVIAIGAYLLGTKQSQPVVQNSVQTTPIPSPTPIDATANWKIYTITPDSSLGYANYQIKLPADWKQIEHPSNFQGTEKFQDAQNVYKLVIEEQKNYNDQTGKPFANFRELIGLSYDVAMVSADGQQAARPLPRAGSEHIYTALFFSRDTKLVYSITLETPRDGSKVNEGNVLFDQILSTFQFTDQGQNTDVVDWEGLLNGKYKNTNNYIDIGNNWGISAEIYNISPGVSLINYSKTFYGSNPFWTKQIVINGYQAILQENFVNVVGDSITAFIMNNTKDKIARVWGIPNIPIAQSVSINNRLSTELINEFQQIISTFEFPN